MQDFHDEAKQFAEEFQPGATDQEKRLLAAYYEIEALKSIVKSLERQLGKFRSDEILMGAVLIESLLDALPEGTLADWQQDLAGAIPAMIYQLAGQINVGFAAEKLRYRFRYGEWPEQTLEDSL